MQSPVQVVTLLRPKTRADLLAASAFSSLVFTATPFLLPAVAEQYEVSLGVASLISTAQLGGFVIASWLVGRIFDPSRRLLMAALMAAMVFNGASAFIPWFSALLTMRFLGGVAIAVIAWLGWQEVFGDNDRMGDVAVVGPIVGIAGAPVASFLADRTGADAVFVMLAIVAIAPMLVRGPSAPLGSNAPRRANRSKAVPVTRVILGCLGLLTLGGSSVFVFAAAIGADDVGLDPVVVSLAFSANALVGIPAARYRGKRPLAGLWFLVTAGMAVAITNVTVGAVFWTAVALWGLAFWAGVPGIFKLLAERSVNPADRAGDAQSMMAAGRMLGPLLGAVFIEKGSTASLGIVAAILMATAAVVLVGVEVRVPPRTEHT
jgi:predicted MFS family arabinose efflux permease